MSERLLAVCVREPFIKRRMPGLDLFSVPVAFGGFKHSR